MIDGALTSFAHFLRECGFRAAGITVDAWGNRACVKANFLSWRKRRPFHPLKNEPAYPVVVWAFTRNVAGEEPSSSTVREFH